MKSYLKLFIICLISLSTTLLAAELTKQDIAQKALESTVMVVVNNESGKPIQLGSGFVIDEGKVVTNHHVVSGGFGGYVQANNKTQPYKILGIIAADKKNDLIVLKVEEHTIPALPFSTYEGVTTGDSVYVVGSPLGFSGTFSEGIISSIRKTGVGTVYQITAPISQGSSGGPVLNNEGVVVGVSTATLNEGQSINFAIPSFYITPLIKSGGSLKPFSYVSLESKQKTQQNKLTSKDKKIEICCAFGIKLGAVINAENLDDTSETSLVYAEHQIKDDRDYAAYFAKKSGKDIKDIVRKKPSYIYAITPTKPYKDLTFYMVNLIDENSKVFKISASGMFQSEGGCERGLSDLTNIIKNKYSATSKELTSGEFIDKRVIESGEFNRNKRVIKFRCERRHSKSLLNDPVLRWQAEESGDGLEWLDKTVLVIEYIDLELEALKDEIAEQYYMNQIDSSGL